MSAADDGAPARVAVTVDDVDRRIIAELQSDGRRPYTRIGPSVGLSEAAVRQRVQRLLDTGAMQIVAVADPRVLGFGRQALIGLRVEGDVRAVADALAAMAEVEYVVITAGSVDVLAEVLVGDDEELIALTDRIRSLPGVREMETTVYLRVHKETYSWGRP